MSKQYTSKEVKKIQADFVNKFYNESMVNAEGKKLTREEFKALAKKHLTQDFFNN